MKEHPNDSSALKPICISSESVNRMNNAIIDGVNAVAQTDDILVFLGDFLFAHYEQQQSLARMMRDRIKCKTIYLVRGNHDKHKYDHFFTTAYDQIQVKIGETFLFLNHYAMLSWDRSFNGSIHCHGHSYGKLEAFKKQNLPYSTIIDVGVDSWDFKPVSFAQIMEISQTLAKIRKANGIGNSNID